MKKGGGEDLMASEFLNFLEHHKWIDSAVGIISLVLSVFSIWFAWYALRASSSELHSAAENLKGATVDASEKLRVATLAAVEDLKSVIKRVHSAAREATQMAGHLAEQVEKINSGLLSHVLTEDRRNRRSIEWILKNAQRPVDSRDATLHDSHEVGTISGGDGSPEDQSVAGEPMAVSRKHGGMEAEIPVQQQVDRAISFLCAHDRRSFKTSNLFKALQTIGLKDEELAAAVSILLDYKYQHKIGWNEQELKPQTKIQVLVPADFNLN